MSRKPTLPGVDQEALASLARQFPQGSVNPDKLGAEPSLRSSAAGPGPAPAGARAPDPVIGPPPITSAAPAPAPIARRGGRGLAFLALLVSLAQASKSAFGTASVLKCISAKPLPLNIAERPMNVPGSLAFRLSCVAMPFIV